MSSTPPAPSSEVVRCEFCGEFFENKKGLSSHARSHLRQMGVTEWHVNGSPIDTLQEILASGTCSRTGTRIGGPSLEKLLPHRPPASPSRSHPYSGLAPAMQHKPPRLPTYSASEWPSELSPLNLCKWATDPQLFICLLIFFIASHLVCFIHIFNSDHSWLFQITPSSLRIQGVTWHQQ